jgi:hypothetical protein
MDKETTDLVLQAWIKTKEAPPIRQRSRKRWPHWGERRWNRIREHDPRLRELTDDEIYRAIFGDDDCA